MAPAVHGTARLLEAGGALTRAAWVETRERLEGALVQSESVEALLGRGIAARALHDAQATVRAHERGYRLAAEGGKQRAAARLALELALDCLTFRDPAGARGWLERADRLLAGLKPGLEQGMLAYLRARFALAVNHDPDTACRGRRRRKARPRRWCGRLAEPPAVRSAQRVRVPG